MIKTILTTTDGSQHGRKAIEFAANLAQACGAKLVIMHVRGQGAIPAELVHMAEIEHVAEPPPRDPSLPRAAIPHGNGVSSGEASKIHEFIGKKILDEAEGVAKAQGLKDIDRVVQDGDPATRIMEIADAEQADMIVMGSRGLGTLKGLLMGSVSQKVGHLARCTTVCVR